MSITLGVVERAFVGLTIPIMWLSVRASAPNPDPSGKETIGFLPLFALMFIGLVNLVDDATGITGTVGELMTRKLNWLGIPLNASHMSSLPPS